MSYRPRVLPAVVIAVFAAIGISACGPQSPSPPAAPSTTSPPPSTSSPTALQPLPTKDCIAHDPTKLSIVDAGPLGWRVVESPDHWMMILDTKADAEKALTVASSYHSHCFIGRNNTRTERRKYITDYWMNPDDASVVVPSPDCIPYNPATVRYESAGSDGWRVVSDLAGSTMYMLLFDTEQDAQDGVIVAQHYTRQCFIGRDNTRSDRYSYIYTYWQPGAVVTPPPVLPTSSSLAPMPLGDCISHDPTKLTIVNAGSIGWQLIDSGTHAMLLLDTQADAEKAKILGSSYHAHCFLGRNNSRTERKRYIFEYWVNPDNATVAIASPDCLPYDPATVHYESIGAGGWRLVATSGGLTMSMDLLDTEQDAKDAVTVAKHYTKQCFIGRNNARTDRLSYIVTYWQ